jgi:3',5'-cyclic AMP phosphodiesterase CpdA
MWKKTKASLVSSLIIVIFILSFISCTKKSESFTFVFMTDIHVQPEKRAGEGFRRAIDKVNSLNPDFVITGGDLIMDALGQTQGRSDSLYNLYQNITAQFKMPVYNTMGNHEVFGLYEKSGISPDNPEYGKQMFKNRLGDGNTYYSFNHKGWHFIILDGIGFTPERSYYGYVDFLQLTWLKNDLANVDKKMPVVISTHIPLFSIYGQMKNGPTFAMGQGGVVTNALDVIKSLENHNLKLVLQGHLHIVEEIRYRGTTYITGGAVSGAWWNGAMDGFPEGFTVVEANKDDFSWEYMTYGWQAENSEK